MKTRQCKADQIKDFTKCTQERTIGDDVNRRLWRNTVEAVTVIQGP